MQGLRSDAGPRFRAAARVRRAIAAVAIAIVPSSLVPGLEGNAEAARRPNIVVVVTDDQTLAMLSPRVMPKTTRLLGGNGVTFTDAIVTTPTCCPSRASLLTGQYAHNHGTLSNLNGYAHLRNPRNTLPVWLKRAGYRTAHVGKYLNAYARVAGRRAVAPGWDRWFSAVERRAYYDYAIAEDGRRVEFGSRPRHHLTKVLNRKAVRLVRRYGRRSRPLYLQLDHFAPHRGRGSRGRCQRAPSPAPGDGGLFAGQPLPQPPSFNERNVSGKPSFMRAMDRVGKRGRRKARRLYGCALASLRAVDDGIGRLWRQLGRSGARRNTAIIFTSDNGYFYLEHRIRPNKVFPYEEGIRVPLIVRLPPRRGGPRGSRSPAPVANIDLAPTILHLARARPCRARSRCRVMDGRSLVGPLRGSSPGWASQRAFAIEFARPRDRVPVRNAPCRYRGVRTVDHTYVRHLRAAIPNTRRCRKVSESEHYDLRDDPFQLRNLFPAPSGTADERQQRRLRKRLARLASCRGIKGRDPAPSRGSFCE